MLSRDGVAPSSCGASVSGCGQCSRPFVMRTVFVSDRIVAEGRIFSGSVTVEDGVITAVTEGACAPLPADAVIIKDRYLMPGFVELHTHGGGGHDFLTGDPDAVLAGCHFHLRHGTTTILPTVSAAPFPAMVRATEAIAAAMRDRRLRSCVPGAHLEGPYLSAKQAGAQCPDFITPPRAEEYLPFLERYGDAVARWTYAPEVDTDVAFCRALVRHGVLPSMGHTDAAYEDVKRAMEAGCRLVTHFYSCMSTVTRHGGFRRLGVIESAYLEDGLFVEMIADGRHLPPELVRLIVKLKGERAFAVSDSLSLAGTDAGEGMMGATPYIIEDGVCKLRDRSAFAGSIATSDRLLSVLVRECGFSVPQASEMLSGIPASLLGVGKGRIRVGLDADFAVLDDDLCVCGVYVGGRAYDGV